MKTANSSTLNREPQTRKPQKHLQSESPCASQMTSAGVKRDRIWAVCRGGVQGVRLAQGIRMRWGAVGAAALLSTIRARNAKNPNPHSPKQTKPCTLCTFCGERFSDRKRPNPCWGVYGFIGLRLGWLIHSLKRFYN